MLDLLFWTSKNGQQLLSDAPETAFFDFTDLTKRHLDKKLAKAIEESIEAADEQALSEENQDKDSIDDKCIPPKKRLRGQAGPVCEPLHEKPSPDSAPPLPEQPSPETEGTQDENTSSTSESERQQQKTLLLARELKKRVPEGFLLGYCAGVSNIIKGWVGPRYFDEYFGLFTEEETGSPQEKEHYLENCMKHYAKAVKTEDGSHETLHWWAFHNCLSPHFKRMIWSDANSTRWMSSEFYAPLANKGKTRYTRIADVKGPRGAFHLKSSGSAGLLAGDYMSEVEQKIQLVMTKVMDLLDEAIEKCVDDRFRDSCIPKYQQTQLQMLIGTVMGSSYSMHDDSSPMLCKNTGIDHGLHMDEKHLDRHERDLEEELVAANSSTLNMLDYSDFPVGLCEEPSDVEHGTEQNQTSPPEGECDKDSHVQDYEKANLPSLFDLRVPTLTMCNVEQDELDYGDPSQAIAHLKIYSKADLRQQEESTGFKAKPVVVIDCFACTFHIQGFGAQLYTKHQVSPSNCNLSVGNSRVVRLVISGRNPMRECDEPHYHAVMSRNGIQGLQPKSDYRYRGVYSALAAPGTEPVEVGNARAFVGSSSERPVDDGMRSDVDPIIKAFQDSVRSCHPGEDPFQKKKFTIQLPPGYVQSPQTLESLVLCGVWQRNMRRHNIAVTIKMPDCLGGKHFLHGRVPQLRKRWRPGSSIPIAFDPNGSNELQPGDIVKASDVFMLCHIVNKRDSKHTCHREHWAMNNALFWEHAYKNGMDYLQEEQECYSLLEKHKKLNAAICSMYSMSFEHQDNADNVENFRFRGIGPCVGHVLTEEHSDCRKRNGNGDIVPRSFEAWLVDNGLLTWDMTKCPEWIAAKKFFYMSGTAKNVAMDLFLSSCHRSLEMAQRDDLPWLCPRPPTPNIDWSKRWMGSSMGSSQINGGTAVESKNLPTGKNNIACGMLCHPQEFDSVLSSILGKMTTNESIFSLFSAARKEDCKNIEGFRMDRSSKGTHTQEYFQYLGEKQFTQGTITQRDSLATVLEQATKHRIDKSERVYLTYRMMPHWRFYFKDFHVDPASKTKDPVNISIQIERQRGGRCTASVSEKLGFIIEEKNAWKDQLSATEAFVEPHEALWNEFFNGGLYKDYLDGQDSSPQESSDSASEEVQRTNDGRSVPVPEVVNFMAHNVVATAARALRQNLVDDNGIAIDPESDLPPTNGFNASILYQTDYADSLCDVVRGSVLPSPVRTNDVTMAFMINSWINFVDSEDNLNYDPPPGAKHLMRRIHPSEMPIKTQNDLLFTIILMRMTGRVEAWNQFFHRTKNKAGGTLLSTNEHEDFMRFLNGTCGGTWQDKMTHWISDQMKDSLPKKIISTPGNFLSFVRVIKDLVTGERGGGTSLFQDMMHKCKRDSGDMVRNEAVKHLRAVIDLAVASTTDNDKGKTDFIADNVVRDVEEIVDDPFGEVTSTVFGHGSKTGCGFIFLEGSHKKITMLQVCEEVKHYMETQVEDDLLGLFGYYKEWDDGSIRQILNGRRFNVVDAEHFICKCYIGSAYSRGTRTYNSHHLARPHCHPTRTKGLHTDFHDQVFRNTLECYNRLRVDGKFPKCPNMFKCYHERDGVMVGNEAPSRDPKEYKYLAARKRRLMSRVMTRIATNVAET